MYRAVFILLLLLLTLPAFGLKVVATLPYLGDISREIGGDDVDVTVLAPATADPHYVDGRPSYLVALRSADVLVFNGLELEVGWLPPLVDGARNSNILPGTNGSINASQFAGPFLQVGNSDRRMGDVHPAGNPHFQWDPRRVTNIAIGLARQFATLDPDNAAAYKTRAAAYKARMSRKLRAWAAALTSLKGQPLIAFHNSQPYFASWIGANVIATVEPVPGIPPTAKDLARAILLIRKRGVKYLIAESWYNPEAIRVIEEKTGVTVVRVPGDVGAGGTRSYIELMDRFVGGFAPQS